MTNRSGEWKWIDGFHGIYKINPIGDVIRVDVEPNKIINGSINSNGYRVVGLTKNKRGMNYLVHRLLATAFIPNPEGKSIINHKDGDKLNNSLENLEWCTRYENIKHAYDNKLLRGSTLTKKEAVEIYNLKGVIKQQDIAKMYGVGTLAVRLIHIHKTWRSVTSQLSNFKKRSRQTKVYCEELKKEFNSIKEAAKAIGGHYTRLGKALKNNTKFKGYTFRYSQS